MRRVAKIVSRRLSNTQTNKGPLTRKADKRAESLGIEVCDVCQNCFYSKSSLAVHKRVHFKDRLFDCNVCHKRFITMSSLRSHKKVHAAANKMSENVLSKSKKIVTAKKSERNKKANQSHRCNVCGKTYKSNISLAIHKRVHGGLKTNKRSVKFNVEAPKVANSNKNKTKMAGTTLKCGFCHKVFMSERVLTKHIISVHSHEKAPSTQRAKRSRPTNERKEEMFSCDLCSKTFPSALGAQNHKNSKHRTLKKGNQVAASKVVKTVAVTFPTEGKVFHCYLCNETFAGSAYKSKQYRRDHLESHKDSQGRLKCRFCPLMYTNSVSFSNHQRSHNERNKKEFKVVTKVVKQAKTTPKEASKNSTVSRQKTEKSTTVTPKSTKPASVRNRVTPVAQTPANSHSKRSRRTPGSSNSAKNILFNMDENFKCGICTKEFSSNSSLEMHKKTHLKDSEDSESMDTAESNDDEECMNSLVLVEKLDDKILDAVDDSVSESENSMSTSENEIVAVKNDAETRRVEESQQSEETISDNSEEIIVDVDDANKISIEKEFAKDCGFTVDGSSSFTGTRGTEIEIVPLGASLNTVEIEISAVDTNLKTTNEKVVLLDTENGIKNKNTSPQSEKFSQGSPNMKVELDSRSKISSKDISLSPKTNSSTSPFSKNTAGSPSGKISAPSIIRLEKPTSSTTISLKGNEIRASILSKEKQNDHSIISKEKQGPLILSPDKKTSTIVFSNDKKNTPSIFSNMKQTSPSMTSKEHKTGSFTPSKEKQTSPSMLSKEKQGSPSILSKEKQSSPSILPKEKQTSLLTVSKEKQTSPSMLSKEKQTSPSILSKEKQTSPSILSKEKQTSPSILSKEKQTSPSILSKEKHTSSSILSKDKQASSSMQSKEKQTIPTAVIPPSKNESTVSLKLKEESLSNGGNHGSVGSSAASSKSNEVDVKDVLGAEGNVSQTNEQKDSENPELKGIIAFINDDFGVST